MLPLFFSAAIILLNAGNCISPLLADQKTKDCCSRGKCSPARKSDSCCQTSSGAAASYFQAAEKFTLSAQLAVGVDYAVPVEPFSPSFLAIFGGPFEHTTPWPPGTSPSVSLPLLV
jgi:hypothetical protein